MRTRHLISSILPSMPNAAYSHRTHPVESFEGNTPILKNQWNFISSVRTSGLIGRTHLLGMPVFRSAVIFDAMDHFFRT
jgi:hypothetical protein